MKAREAILYSFGKLLTKKPYYKITVREVAEHAKVTRQIFYYYFDNMVELFYNFCEKEASLVIRKNKKYNTLEDAYKMFLKVLESKRDLIKNANYPESVGAFRMVLEQLSKNLFLKLLSSKFEEYNISEKNKESILNYYKLSLSSVMYNWVNNGMEDDKEELIKNLKIFIDNNIDNVFSSFAD